MSDPEQRIIVVAGANGHLGKLVCESLLSRARAAGQPLLVRGLVRKSSANAEASAPGSPSSEQQLVVVIKLAKFFKPGKKDEPMPMWVGMQYAYCMALGTASPEHLDNDRYPDIRWTGADDVVRAAFEAPKTAMR